MAANKTLRRFFVRSYNQPPCIISLYLKNHLIFLGILQPPLYHPDYPNGFNYGAIGMIIGHEITHGFDDQGQGSHFLKDCYKLTDYAKLKSFFLYSNRAKGRHMGADGNMDNWWGEETAENFKNRSQCMIEQYSKLRFADMNLNGQLTLGENIADNGGIKIAYQAWVRVLILNKAARIFPDPHFFIQYESVGRI